MTEVSVKEEITYSQSAQNYLYTSVQISTIYTIGDMQPNTFSASWLKLKFCFGTWK